MTEDWHQTNQIVMAVQTADIRHDGVHELPRLTLSCNLMNIARGQCQLELSGGTPTDSDDIGSLVIEVDRPVMRASATIPQHLYDAMANRLANTPPRPISITMKVAGQLAVSIEGDLRINSQTSMTITDLAISLPLK